MAQKITRNNSTSSGSNSGGNGSTSSGQTSGESISMVEEPSWKPNDIIGLGDGYQILFVPNHGGSLWAKREPYFTDDWFASLRDSIVKDPYHMTDAEFETFKATLPGSCLDPERTGEPGKITPTLRV